MMPLHETPNTHPTLIFNTPFMSTLDTRFYSVAAGLLITFLFGIGAMQTAHAQQPVPQVITYQGTLADADGPVVGDVELTFRFFDGPEDGAAQLPAGEAWQETYTRTIGEDAGGRFSVPLGSKTPLTDVLDSGAPLWLEVTVDGEELSRTRLTSTAFALRAEQAEQAQRVADGAAVRRLNVAGSDGASIAQLADDVTVQEGDNVTLSADAETGTLTISAAGPEGGLSSVAVLPPLTGDGTSESPVTLADGTTVRQLNVAGSDGASIAQLADNVTVQEGDNVTLSADAETGTLTISAVAPEGGLASVTSDGTLTGEGTSAAPLGLADEAVTPAKLAGGTAVRSLTARTNSGAVVTTLVDSITVRAGDNVTFGQQDGELTISAAGPEGGISSVSSNQTLSGNGTASDPLSLAPDAVTSANIFDGEVKSDDLGPGAVTEAKILDGAVSAAKISDAAAVKSLNTVTGNVSLTSTDNSLNVASSPTDDQVDLSLAPDAAVRTLNGLAGGVSLVAGNDNVAIDGDGTDQITISSVDTGLLSVASDGTLAGAGTADSELGIAENGVGRAELASGVAVDQLNGLTGGVTIETSGGAQISQDASTNTITIDAGAGSGSSEIQSISNTDGALDVTNNSGSVTINVADGGITTADLADNAVNGGVIQDGSVQGVDLADGAVGTDQLANGAVTAAELADGSVSTAALQDNAVTSAQIANGTITADDLGTGSVGSGEIVDGAVGANDLSGNAAVLGLTPPSNNTLRGNVSLNEGTNIDIEDDGNEITISAASTGLSEVATSDQFEGNGTDQNPLSLALGAVTQAEIASGAVGSDELQSNAAVTALDVQNNGSPITSGLRDVVTLSGGDNVSLSSSGSVITFSAADPGLLSVSSDGTLTGDGTEGNELGIANGGVGPGQLAADAVTAAKLADDAVRVANIDAANAASADQVLSYNGSALEWTDVGSGDITASGNAWRKRARRSASAVRQRHPVNCEWWCQYGPVGQWCGGHRPTRERCCDGS